MHHDVRAQGERPLEERAHEGVVHHSTAPRLRANAGEGRDVADLHQGVGGGLDPEQREVARRPVEGRGVGMLSAGLLTQRSPETPPTARRTTSPGTTPDG